jgi:diguanylate cyclase (GGDEF)-like protein
LTTTPSLHPHIESLIHSITSVTGHDVAFESWAALPPASSAAARVSPTIPIAASPHTPQHTPQDAFEVVGTAGDRYGVLRIRGGETMSDAQRALYAQLSRMIAHEADLRREKSSLENRFRRLDRHNAELTALNRSLSAAAYRDSLTGVYRRWYLVEQIRLEMLRAVRLRWPVSLLLFDVVRFTEVNERFGAAGSDAVLREVASRIARTSRVSDVVGRLHGDVFAALLPGTPAAGAHELARRVSTAIGSEPFACGSELLVLSVTCSCTTYEGAQHETAEGFLESATQALHRVKRGA